MNTGHEERIDAAIRAVHADALDHLSPRTRAQLQLRRRAALSGVGARAPSSAWRFAWPVAAALALGAVVIGLQFRGLETPAPQVAATAAPATNPDDAYTSLEENPDLYLWLASDGAQLAME
jgi:hypothetical protein